ncbi:hypothetical protein [Sorangium cellulosum]|uniref:Uncharacterized protein n=1 Tax=Sorangium cellulosum So0157-2 TaxID=1254432 RepID=S4Y9K7_SORCE|nr:hypothetical protein [Sorangium cellulosum]AGP41006.1 hypothetical protein SCE1572_44840 [Sorangium cellulosum So0157-2]
MRTGGCAKCAGDDGVASTTPSSPVLSCTNVPVGMMPSAPMSSLPIARSVALSAPETMRWSTASSDAPPPDAPSSDGNGAARSSVNWRAAARIRASTVGLRRPP